MTEQPTNCITLHESGYEPGQEVIRIDKEGFHYRGQFISDVGEAHRLMVEFLRQNTQSEPQGPTDVELDELFTEIDQSGESESWRSFALAVLTRWGRPSIKPVPVAERLPGPEDCDAEGWCWVASEDCPAWHRVSCHFDAWHYWLPHHALPVPQNNA